MSEPGDPVQRHFDRSAARFDSIYSGRKSALGRLMDRVLRWDVQERMKLTLAACQPIAGKEILDVGCGTGRYCLALAQAGAARVVGVDFAPAMIEQARDFAKSRGLEPSCTFLCADILSVAEHETFDYVVAIGLFDYIQDDRHLLVKLRRLTKEKLIATFPRADTWRAPLRKLRLSLLRCPVYFYTEKRIRDHLLLTGFMIRDLRRVGKLYYVEAS